MSSLISKLDCVSTRFPWRSCVVNEAAVPDATFPDDVRVTTEGCESTATHAEGERESGVWGMEFKES